MGENDMLRTYTLLRRTALLAAGATAMVSLAACGSSDEGSAKSGEDKGSTSGSDTSTSETKPEDSGKDGPKTESAPLQLGEAAAESVEVTRSDKTGEFRVSIEKVTLGKPGDLDELKDKKKYEGKRPAWLYATYKHVGGDAPAELSAGDLGLTVEGGDQARPLMILLGGLSATPEDCVKAGDIEPLKSEESATVCRLFLVPETKGLETAQVSRGFTTRPTEWEIG
jgi:hypothetical protein